MRRPAYALVLASTCALSLPSLAAAKNGHGATSRHEGRPTVTLDRLDLSPAPLAVEEEKYLRAVLGREGRNADWGAGRGAHVQYRVRIDELTVKEAAGVLEVRCSATGWLPKGRKATSHLTFGGAPKDRATLTEHVLEIVSRGLVTRLADLERRRRGE